MPNYLVYFNNLNLREIKREELRVLRKRRWGVLQF